MQKKTKMWMRKAEEWIRYSEPEKKWLLVAGFEGEERG